MKQLHHNQPRHQTATAAPGGAFRLGVLFGFPVYVHWSWLIAFALVTWSLASGFFAGLSPEWTERQRWGVGALTSLLLFGSVLAHELVHAIVGRRRGHTINDITLYVFGGAAAMGHEPRRARDEFWIALSGPLASVAAAGLFGALWLAGRVVEMGPASAIAGYLAVSNVALALFNMLPAFPLDGGRVLRSVLWGMKGDMLGATRTAATTGKVMSWLLVAAGIAIAATGSVVSGVWLVLIGWYLAGAATTSYQQLLVQSSLAGVPVEALVERDVPRVAPDMMLDELAQTRVLGRNQSAFFVSPTEDGDVLGLVTVADLRRVPVTEWPTTSVYRAMTPIHRLIAATPSTEALEALHSMVLYNLNQMPVFRGRDVVGLLTRARLAQAIQLRGALGKA